MTPTRFQSRRHKANVVQIVPLPCKAVHIYKLLLLRTHEKEPKKLHCPAPPASTARYEVTRLKQVSRTTRYENTKMSQIKKKTQVCCIPSLLQIRNQESTSTYGRVMLREHVYRLKVGCRWMRKTIPILARMGEKCRYC